MHGSVALERPSFCSVLSRGAALVVSRTVDNMAWYDVQDVTIRTPDAST